ncbi:MAG: GAF domain-containing protein [Proteobacteria bacterium]|nr:GAF domain-containing protein [Pseudomonadota bacterium]
MKISERFTALNGVIQSKTSKIEDVLPALRQLNVDVVNLEEQIEILSVAGAELNKVQEQSTILEIILHTARKLTNADGGTVYVIEQEFSNNPFNPGELASESLSFEVLQNETLEIFNRSTSTKKIPLPPVPLVIDGKPNHKNVSAYCANTGEIINIKDVYHTDGFDFSGAKKYDETTGYRSQSMLVIPLRDHEKQINGVLQLINRKNDGGRVIPFTKNDEVIVQSLSYQTAVSLTTQTLLKEQVNLFNAFVQVLAEGLGEKSPYTFGHIDRVAFLTVSLAIAVSDWEEGMYKHIEFDDNQKSELELAGWMHDIGKLTTPEHIVSKSVKLKSVFDRIELIVERFNSKVKDIEIEALNREIEGLKQNKGTEYFEKIIEDRKTEIAKLAEDIAALCQANLGGEFLTDELSDRIEKVSKVPLLNHFHMETKDVAGEEIFVGVKLKETAQHSFLLNKAEKDLLMIQRGTLSAEERGIINDHADRSWRWLMKLPFPKKMMKLPLYAGAHHETLDGKGYPNALKANQQPIQSRIIAIVDIFEALTASDRPYKRPMQLSKALEILGSVVKKGELDAEVVSIFLKSGVYLEYAEEFLDKDQIDEVDIDHWIQTYYPDEFKNTL